MKIINIEPAADEVLVWYEVPAQPARFTLELTEEEALVLAKLYGSAGGAVSERLEFLSPLHKHFGQGYALNLAINNPAYCAVPPFSFR